MARQRESRWKDRLREAFYARYGDQRGAQSPHARMLCIEGSSGQQKGLPDRYFAASGYHAWVEIKCDERTTEPLQRLQLWRLAKSGRNAVLLRVLTAQEALMVYRVSPELLSPEDVDEPLMESRKLCRVFLAKGALGSGDEADRFWEWFWGLSV